MLEDMMGRLCPRDERRYFFDIIVGQQTFLMLYICSYIDDTSENRFSI